MKSFNWVIPTAIVIVVALLGYFFCLNHVGVNHVGVAYDSGDGTVTTQDPGWHTTSPFTFVVSISTLPVQVTIPSEAKVINSKIVKFRKEGAVEFIHLQGFSWFLDQKLDNILLGYAYSGKSWPFLEIIEEGKGVVATAQKP